VTSNPDFNVTVIQRRITKKRYQIELYLQWRTNRKWYMVYRTAPFSMTFNDPYPQFQGYAILWCWISHKRYDIQTQFQWNTNSELHTPYATVSFRMTLSDPEWLSMTRSVTRSLCDSWASCLPISGFISELMQDRAIVTMEGEYETAHKLSNDTILNDLEWPLTQISRSRYYSASNNSKRVQDRVIFTMADQ